MQEVQEDFRDKDDFKYFERILQEKIDEARKNNRELGTLGSAVSRLKALQESQEQRLDEDSKMQQEINHLRQKTSTTERENEQIDRQLNAVEASLKQQEVIFSEYNEKIGVKKNEYSVFMEKLDIQQDLYRKRLKQLDRELETLHEVQEELAFLFNASSKKMTSNSQFLDYIKSLEGKDTLKYLKQRLNLETTKQPRRKAPEKAPQEEEVAEQHAESEALNLKTFKDILKSVLSKDGK